MGLSKAVTMIGVSSVVLVAVAVAVAVTLNKGNHHDGQVTTSNKAVNVMCEAVDYKDTCVKSLSTSDSEDPKELMKTGFKAAISNIGDAIGKSKTLEDASKDPRTQKAYELCKELLDTSVKDLNRSVDRVGQLEASKMEEYVLDVKTWLTGAIDYQETCIDAFENTTGDAADKMKNLLKISNELSSNALAMMSDIKSIVSSLHIPGIHRRLFDYDYETPQGPQGDPPPNEDPASQANAGTHKRRLLDYDYETPHGDPPPNEDPGGPYTAKSHKRRLLDYDYETPHGDPPPNEDPGTPYNARNHKRGLLDYDNETPQGDPPPNEDPGIPFNVRNHKRGLLDYDDETPHGDPPPNEDTGFSAGTRRLYDAAYGPPNEHSLAEDPGQGAAATVRRVFDNDNESQSDNGNDSKKMTKVGKASGNGNNLMHDAEQISKARKVGGTDDLPEWAGKHQRSLLQANPKPNAVVALDGSGQFKTISDAIKTVPANNVKAFVILVKAGVYKEYVDIPRGTNNIVMMGEGATKTKVTGNKNFIDGVNTFKTATFAINGDGFMAKDMGFENSAGAAKHQAVALRVSGDRAIFFQCQMDGYQDTLYTHTYRQFYRDCTITGTIDFIFGDAAAIFQNCKMIVRKPMDNQGCMVTAQGRKDRRSTGGNILQNCQITAEPAFMQANPPIKSYLGRPWKEFSRTIVMQSFIDSNIAPDGWSPWTGNFGQDTCYYVEYQNRGPGSDTSKRVTWKGVQKNVSPQVISQFTAASFFQGDAWIPVAGIPYDPGMMKV
ncbi:hypothetical protein DCAR_0102582 [Daucus carota subsp. sativus]|uniref:pectinesterase n=1 Tax=Daucus carota subsp. sativus TaxID=79200 RepID=A0A169WS58_DAUCS|nr:PREDICTED: probable pectinesterase/pectinesterase inhibitor 21 [Daucus carota subsp. sativus]WOG83407.1 hypothetical protein DCAR_0102582 [Daucus carota subsp. sativus]